MTGSAKRKGSAYEREVVSLLTDAGFENVHRVPLSGAVKSGGGRYVADVLASLDGYEYRIECKRRKAPLKFIVDNLQEAEFLFIRPDRGETTVSMSWETFLEMTKK